MAPHVQEILNFKCVKSIRTVYSLLEERNALNVLSDQYVALATKEIIANGRSPLIEFHILILILIVEDCENFLMGLCWVPNGNTERDKKFIVRQK
jgi:hypothetical protein